MREAHAHIAQFGRSLGIPSLEACRSVAECLDTVGRAAAGARPGGWVLLRNARIQAWEEARWPTRAELDRAAGVGGIERPCVMMSFDHHAAAANSAALAAAGLRGGDRVAPSGLVEEDPHTGAATGLLIEHAAYRVWQTSPQPTEPERLANVERALAALAGLGYTEVHDLLSEPWLGPALARLERTGRWPAPIRQVRLYPPIERLIADHAGRAAWESPRVRLAGGKLFADGTLNSGTALMLEPYRDPPAAHPRGVAMASMGQIVESLRTAESIGLHLATHAIGDAAVRMVLDAIEAVQGGRIRDDPARRHRIEHAEVVDGADAPRFARLGVVCSVQPCHLLADVEVLTRRLPHRLGRVLPLRELIDHGCAPGGDEGLLWFGSDVPVVRADSQDSVQAAVHRRRVGTGPAAAIALEQAITEAEAKRAFGVGHG